MNNPIPTSRHTVPALREQARNVRARADEVQQDVDQLRAAADEIDAMANELETQQRDAAAASPPRVGDVDSCRGCGQPIAWDGLGWTHATRTECTALIDARSAVQAPAAGPEATA